MRSSTSPRAAADHRLLGHHCAVLVRVEHHLRHRRRFQLRAVATDRACYSATSDTVSTTSPTASWSSSATPATSSADHLAAHHALQRRHHHLHGPAPVCPRLRQQLEDDLHNLSSPYSCSWNTANLANGDYDLRSVATAGSTTTTSAIVDGVLVDNAAPTVSMVDPARRSPCGHPRRDRYRRRLRVAQVVVQAAVTGTSSWTSLCTITAAPYSCRYDTAQLTHGSYSLRAVATDAAGNATTSPRSAAASSTTPSPRSR